MKCNIGLKWVNSIFFCTAEADSWIFDGEAQKRETNLR